VNAETFVVLSQVCCQTLYSARPNCQHLQCVCLHPLVTLEHCTAWLQLYHNRRRRMHRGSRTKGGRGVLS
jgi:hypothetical protein